MRYIVVIGALLLSACASSQALETVATTPASIELAAWCKEGDLGCRQKVADRAEQHCRQNAEHAQYIRATLMERNMIRGERWWFVYSCVH